MLPLLGLLAATACATVETTQRDGFTVDKDYTERAFDAVRNRAACELSCAREQLQLVVLNTEPSLNASVPSQIGATGCDHRAVYVRVASGQWVMNSADGQPK
jgi:hypothetical protein